jgi:catechol 2,3-dioxygenase-like lactoylglutathione lyase family enzyme
MPGQPITRRQFGGLFAAFAAADTLRAVERPLELSHFKLRVADLDRSLGFYYRLFGGLTMEIAGGSHFAPPDMRAVVLKIAPGVIYMILSAPDPKTPVGLEHIALDTRGVDLLRRYHMAPAFPNEPYIRDPDGNWVEFSAAAGGDWSGVPRAIRPQLPGNPAIKPPVFQTGAIERVAIKVLDLTRAAEFYRHFGAEMGLADSGNAKSFDFGGTTLELVASRQAPGLAGFTVTVRNFEPSSARRALHKAGIKTTRIHDRIAFHDPDGNQVELASA